MAGESKTFNFNFDVTKVGNTFTVNGAPIGGAYIIRDDRSGGAGDSTSLLGDVTNDSFTSQSVSTGGMLSRTYVGKTSNGFISKLNNTSSVYYFYSNSSYANGATVSNFQAANTSDPSTFQVVCFATGTLISTARGEVAVESLTLDDLAVIASGAHRPIRWIGSRFTDCRRHPDPAAVMPVRIAAGALGENRPARDLVVSPGHAICLDVLGEVLIPASVLINGTTITQQDVDSVTYWHVELDSHDILIAEGQPAESYLNMGNRSFFAECDVVDLNATPDGDTAAPTHADFCRPFHNEGALVDVVRAQIQARAERLGWRLDDAPWAGMHLMVDGVRVEARTHGLSARFVVPASAQDVWLISDTSVPREISTNQDPRRLGLLLQAISIDDGIGEKRSVSLDDPLLCLGFHAYEEGGVRWTAGRSRFPAALFADCHDTVFLRIEVARPAMRRWVAPEATAGGVIAHDAPHLSLVA